MDDPESIDKQWDGLASLIDAKLIANAPTMLSLLRELEYSATVVDEHGEDMLACAICADNPHTPDCRLARLLSELK